MEPYDHNGDNQYDGIRGILEFTFVIACSIPGDEVGVLVSTQVVSGVRCYRLEVTDGPATGASVKAVDVYDAISAMDQILVASGYSMSYQETSDYRDAWKTWLINNWISADDFHSSTGY
ncbi:MAG: hypothetical protein KF869_11620 [Phycisphaeraceae bacterium]|nr:hypothetical protein [Phycisphaeraceae bacterium]